MLSRVYPPAGVLINAALHDTLQYWKWDPQLERYRTLALEGLAPMEIAA